MSSSIKNNKSNTNTVTPWWAAAYLCEQYALKPQKADLLLAELPSTLSSIEARRAQFLFLGVLRHYSLLDNLIKTWVKKNPKRQLKACLRVAIYELLETSSEDRPAAVHYAVDQAKKKLSKPEQGLMNAVLRRAVRELDAFLEAIDISKISGMALRFSHPEWLVSRWVDQLGMDKTRSLLEWNQKRSSAYLHLIEGDACEGLKSTTWDGFYTIDAGKWNVAQELLDTGKAYVQDPSTHLGTQALGVNTGDRVLDLCSAPGGKTWQLARKVGEEGSVVSLDLPGPRIGSLKENKERMGLNNVEIVEADLLEVSLNETFDAVYMDVPCSNTGVLQRRPDAKWRLNLEDLAAGVQLQVQLLEKAAKLVKPSGYLLYSTCSIDTEENQAQVDQFLAGHPSFSLKTGVTYLPQDTGHDGCGVYLFARAGSE